jgi:hypothetical protein
MSCDNQEETVEDDSSDMPMKAIAKTVRPLSTLLYRKSRFRENSFSRSWQSFHSMRWKCFNPYVAADADRIAL